MGHHVLPGNPPVELSLRRSPRARRISLRVSGLDGRVTLTLPRGVPEAEALDFARTKADWLRAQMAQRPVTVAVTHGLEMPLEGQVMRIAQGTGRRVVQGDATLHVPGGPDTAAVEVDTDHPLRLRRARPGFRPAAVARHRPRQVDRREQQAASAAEVDQRPQGWISSRLARSDSCQRVSRSKPKIVSSV
jgi:hypothetical protein